MMVGGSLESSYTVARRLACRSGPSYDSAAWPIWPVASSPSSVISMGAASGASAIGIGARLAAALATWWVAPVRGARSGKQWVLYAAAHVLQQV